VSIYITIPQSPPLKQEPHYRVALSILGSAEQRDKLLGAYVHSAKSGFIIKGHTQVKKGKTMIPQPAGGKD